MSKANQKTAEYPLKIVKNKRKKEISEHNSVQQLQMLQKIKNTGKHGGTITDSKKKEKRSFIKRIKKLKQNNKKTSFCRHGGPLKILQSQV